MSSKILRELYRRDPTGNRAVVVQNLKENVRKDNLQNYLEVICSEELTDIYFPVEGAGVAIAVFEKDVEEIDQWQEKASKRRFEGSSLNLQLLCEPVGIFIADIPGQISEEYLSLYFESKRSGGEEDTVQNVQIVDAGSAKHAIIEISSDTAIKSVLFKQTHQLRNNAVIIEPYYRSVHRHFTETLKPRQGCKETGMSAVPQRDIMYEQTTPLATVSPRQQQLKPLRVSSPMQENEESSAITHARAFEHMSQSPNSVSTEQTNYDSNPIHERIKLKSAGHETSDNDFKLKIISDDTADQEVETPINRPDRVALPNPQEYDTRRSTAWHDQDKDRNYGVSNVQTPNVAAVKPVVRNVQRQVSNDSEDGSSRAKNGRRKRTSKVNEKQRSLCCEAEIRLSPVKIIMLIIFRFQKKTQTDTLKVIFKEKEGKLILNGSSDEDITDAKLKVHECVEQIVCCTESLSRMKCMFLSRQACRDCLRARCIKQKVRAAFEVDESKSILKSHAFSVEDAEKGLQLVKDEIFVSRIQLRPGQEQFLNDEDWNRMIEVLDSGLTTIYLDESANKMVLIESFVDTKAKDANRKIIEYLKQHVPKKTGEVVLEEAKAKCFKSCFEEKLRRNVEKRHGQFEVKEQSRTPLKIRICVEGEESLTEELTRMVNQIWHEKIDFSRISDKAIDKWLMMKGLDSSLGTDFLKNFEKHHNCFIQVSKDGDFKIPKPKIQIEDAGGDDLHRQASDTRSTSDSEFEVLHNDFEQESEQIEARFYERRKYEKQKERGILYQGGMDYDEALAQAIQNSTENLDFLPRLEMTDDDDDDERSGLRFAHRQQSEGDIDERRYLERRAPHRNLRKSASSPVFKNQFSVTKTESIQMLQTTVTLIQGEIVSQRADVLVNIVSPNHSLTESVVSKAFVKRAGPQIIQMYDDARSFSNGTVVKTDSCGRRLHCSSVFHVTLQKGEKYCQKMINEVISEVFEECENDGYTSVAFPPLGVGRMYKYPPEIVAERMLAEICILLQNGTYRINQVTVVVYDDATYAVFEKAFQSFDERLVNRYSAVPVRQYFNQNPFPIPAVQNQYQPHIAQNSNRLAQQQMLRQKMLQQVSPNAARLMPAAFAQRSKPQPSLSSVNTGGVSRQAPDSRFDQLKQQRRLRDRVQTASKVPRSAIRQHSSDRKPDRMSSGRSRVISERDHRHGNYRMEQADRHGERPKTKQTPRTPRSRFPEKKPAPNLTVVVVAEKKELCVVARNQLGKSIHAEFLHEDSIDKRQKISEEAKRKIVSIIDKHNIESIKEKQKYILRGHKESVARARMGILEVLLEERDNTDKRRKRKENAKKGTKEFVQYMVEEEPEIPSYWSKYKPDVTLKSILTKVKHAFTKQNYEKVPLDSNGDAFKTIVRMVASTFDSSKVGQGQDAAGLNAYSQLYVVKIQRIENLELYDKFTSARQKVFLQLLKSGDVKFPKVEQLPNCTGGPIQSSQFVNASLNKDLHTEINEVLLFHGTKDENIGTICTSGLDQRLGSGKAMFGPGIYGAECSTKADQYADDKTARTVGQGISKKMFLIRMVLGNSYLCSDQNPHKYRRPPCTSCYKDDCKDTKHARHKYGHMFDSVVGDNGKLFREFVVYDSALCYPEYLITYERR
ncbi:uncharacterized protein LOC123556644 isoform X2 [Mercenaria mercenaria]|uniref:uncharacterized protein LOC123556644 isoform X2 n=1 Tax=Mercenaria mercenaria TaxID=6596 RepID=UPI00234F1715|nr:uncharacterized protein LOC123556644 isoform X2 [Mercenaria mercenaria]